MLQLARQEIYCLAMQYLLVQLAQSNLRSTVHPLQNQRRNNGKVNKEMFHLTMHNCNENMTSIIKVFVLFCLVQFLDQFQLVGSISIFL